MRILHILAPAPYGGLERVVRDLTSGLSAAGARVDVAVLLDAATPPADHSFVKSLDNCSVTLHAIQTPGRAYFREHLAVRRLCETIVPDVVHTHGYRADVIAASAARACNIATVTTVHGFTGGDFRNRCYEALQRRSFRSFDGVIAVSRPLKAQLARFSRRVHLVQNAWSNTTVPHSAQQARQILGIQRNGFEIAWIGRLSPEKGADVLLDSLVDLNDDVHATFIGDGAERVTLEQRAAQLGLASRVHFPGAIPNAGALLPAFDAFVLSSRTEGTPMVLFEALAARVPVIATRVGGVPDVVNESYADLVPPDDPEAIARAISALRADYTTAKERAARGQAMLHSAFAADRWIDKHLSLYNKLARKVEAA